MIFLTLFKYFTGVPLLFINHNTILLEKPSRASHQASDQVCHLFEPFNSQDLIVNSPLLLLHITL